MPRTAQRPERINLRVSSQSKSTLERAAAFTDKTVTDFVVESALKRAESVVRAHEVIELSGPEWRRFQALLLNPPKPAARLKKALAQHARVVRR
ncbi:MAG: DUF1778 domain-containing protein [Rhodospirillales bacterium]|nr:DUF1778 domain-containing protein [Rhodospirillales bacterium]